MWNNLSIIEPKYNKYMEIYGKVVLVLSKVMTVIVLQIYRKRQVIGNGNKSGQAKA